MDYPVLMSFLFSVALVMPLVSGIASMLTRGASWNNALSQILVALGGALGCVGVGLYLFAGGYAAPIVLSAMAGFVITPLSVFFLSLVYLGSFLTSLYAIGMLPRYSHVYSLPWLNLASGLFIFGMQATILSPTIFSFLLFWEVMSISAYFLVIADRSEESLGAGMLYFIMTHIGFAALMSGFFLLSGGNPFASWNDVARYAATLPPLVLGIAFFLLLAGFGSKAGLVPLHQWLPYAHPQAPSGSSALLSGVMLKVALFGFIQAVFLFPFVSMWWGLAVAGIGFLSALFGVLHASVEFDAKKVLAWSSVENMGLIFSAIGVFLISRAVDMPGLVGLSSGVVLFIMLHTLNHFLFKSGLFMAVGAVASATHTRDLDAMGGLAQKWPLFSGVVLCLALAASALPPFGTFFGEWSYMQSLAATFSVLPTPEAIVAGLMLSIVALVGGLAIFAFARLFSEMFLGRARDEHAEHVSALPRLAMIPPMLSAALLVLSPLVVVSFFGHIAGLDQYASFPVIVATPMDPRVVIAFAAAIAVVLLVLARALSATPVRVTDTWDCGQVVTPRMEYTASGFSAPIRFFFRAFVLVRKELTVEPIARGNRWIARRRLEWATLSLWEEWLYAPVTSAIVRLSSVVKRLQNGIVQMYLILLILALIGALLYAL